MYNLFFKRIFDPWHLQPILRKHPYYGNAVPETGFEYALCLPSGSALANEDQKKIEAVVKRLFRYLVICYLPSSIFHLPSEKPEIHRKKIIKPKGLNDYICQL